MVGGELGVLSHFLLDQKLFLWALSCTQHNLLSTPTHVSLLVCTRRKADFFFPPQQTGATTLMPDTNYTNVANDTWCYFSDLKNTPIQLRN